MLARTRLHQQSTAAADPPLLAFSRLTDSVNGPLRIPENTPSPIHVHRPYCHCQFDRFATTPGEKIELMAVHPPPRRDLPRHETTQRHRWRATQQQERSCPCSGAFLPILPLIRIQFGEEPPDICYTYTYTHSGDSHCDALGISPLLPWSPLRSLFR
jgi:hypothetical protein